ncbi:MAG: hypothetical protein IPG58_16455 [Acidobacteria bacterium]|nr:hypothetical protein [Acidobacteriota bacterium]
MRISKGLTYFERALEFDPNCASALAGMADSYNLLGAGDYAVLQPSEAFQKQRTLRHVLEIDPSMANAHTALGWATMNYDWDLEAAEQHYLRSISLNPNYGLPIIGTQCYSPSKAILIGRLLK